MENVRALPSRILFMNIMKFLHVSLLFERRLTNNYLSLTSSHRIVGGHNLNYGPICRREITRYGSTTKYNDCVLGTKSGHAREYILQLLIQCDRWRDDRMATAMSGSDARNDDRNKAQWPDLEVMWSDFNYRIYSRLNEDLIRRLLWWELYVLSRFIHYHDPDPFIPSPPSMRHARHVSRQYILRYINYQMSKAHSYFILVT